jgi:hypothetical protein
MVKRRQQVARTNREVAIEDMVQTIEEADESVIDWWGDFACAYEAIEQFRAQLGD